jgi:hypothetical protein
VRRDRFIHLVCALLGAVASLITIIELTRKAPSHQPPDREPPETVTPAKDAVSPLQAPSPQPRNELSETVYRTPSGKRYHRATCGHVRGKGIALSLAEVKEQGLTPCKVCNPPP